MWHSPCKNPSWIILLNHQRTATVTLEQKIQFEANVYLGLERVEKGKVAISPRDKIPQKTKSPTLKKKDKIKHLKITQGQDHQKGKNFQKTKGANRQTHSFSCMETKSPTLKSRSNTPNWSCYTDGIKGGIHSIFPVFYTKNSFRLDSISCRASPDSITTMMYSICCTYMLCFLFLITIYLFIGGEGNQFQLFLRNNFRVKSYWHFYEAVMEFSTIQKEKNLPKHAGCKYWRKRSSNIPQLYSHMGTAFFLQGRWCLWLWLKWGWRGNFFLFTEKKSLLKILWRIFFWIFINFKLFKHRKKEERSTQ